MLTTNTQRSDESAVEDNIILSIFKVTRSHYGSTNSANNSLKSSNAHQSQSHDRPNDQAQPNRLHTLARPTRRSTYPSIATRRPSRRRRRRRSPPSSSSTTPRAPSNSRRTSNRSQPTHSRRTSSGRKTVGKRIEPRESIAVREAIAIGEITTVLNRRSILIRVRRYAAEVRDRASAARALLARGAAPVGNAILACWAAGAAVGAALVAGGRALAVSAVGAVAGVFLAGEEGVACGEEDVAWVEVRCESGLEEDEKLKKGNDARSHLWAWYLFV